jgi:Domain of unknown function (DUF4352)
MSQFRPPSQPGWGQPESDPFNSRVQQPFPEWQQQPAMYVPTPPQQQWQPPQYPPPPETYYPPQTPILPPPPHKRMRRNDKIALWIFVSLVVVCAVIGSVVFAANSSSNPSPSLSQASPNIAATATDASVAATDVAFEATAVAVSNSITPIGDTPTPVDTPIPTQQTTGIGATQQADVWSVTLNSVKTGYGDGYLGPKAGNIYLYFNLTAQNTDTNNHLISVIDFNVLDIDGNKYGIAIDSNVQDLSGTVVAGQKLRGYVIYEVPKNVHQFTLQFNPTFDLSQVAQWNVSV